ncbi:MAG: preprotein translocase subunit SecG [Eubacteriales bacterium]
MQILSIILQVILCIFAIVLIVTVLLQPSKGAGVSGALGGASDTSFGGGSKKARGMEAKMARFTKICAVGFMIIAVALLIIQKFS